jgi:hypothetical protein
MPLLQPGSFGFAIAPFSAIGWIVFVTHLLCTAQVSQSPEHWSQIARISAYDRCYNGCYDCINVDSIEEACRMTTKATVSGLVCDASKMWTWADRYPTECLEAIGEIYKANALWWKKLKLCALYLLTILSLPLGILANDAMPPARQATPSPSANRQQRLAARRNTPKVTSTTPLLLTTVLLVLALCAPTSAFACTNHHPAHNQLFASEDNTLYGIIHGWLSNCYEHAYSCGESCATAEGDKSPAAATSCSAISCTETRTDRAPADFVKAVVPKVQACGFRLVDYVSVVVDMRIANPRIEGKLWVKVSVNRFNGLDRVDDRVGCLYDMIDAPQW